MAYKRNIDRLPIPPQDAKVHERHLPLLHCRLRLSRASPGLLTSKVARKPVRTPSIQDLTDATGRRDRSVVQSVDITIS